MSDAISPALAALGFDDFFRRHLSSPDADVGRVAVEHRGRLSVVTARGAADAVIAGKLRHQADAADFPRVGDWVELAPASAGELRVIERVLPRRTSFVRRAVGDAQRMQVVAANVDAVAIVSAASASADPRVQRRGLNLERIERYLAAVRPSGARPLVVINKIDLAADAEPVLALVGTALSEPVIGVSAVRGDGVDALAAAVGPSETLALVGSSGVGKSALTNRLLGHAAGRLGDVRADDERGRHTTTHRELFQLPGGGCLIDTPGMRELGLWWENDELDAAFDEIAELGRDCRFRDCRHAGEPGCAVQLAIERGELDQRRLDSHMKLERELRFEQRKVDPQARQREKRVWRQRARAYRNRDKLGK